MEPAFHAKEITTTVEIPRDLPLVWADAEKIHQVMVNVFANALSATPPHGAVNVLVGARTASSEELDRGPRMTSSLSPQVLTIEVRDTGCGMPESDVQKAFEPFFTTKAVGKGTGLGLFLSRETVLAHGGSLVLESETGRGTTVTITLPGLKAESNVHGGEALMQPANILVADDDTVARDLLAEALKKEGYAVEAFASGEEVIARGRQGRVDLVLTDIRMGAVDGLTVLREFKRMSPDTAVVMLTSFGSLEGRHRSNQARGLRLSCQAVQEGRYQVGRQAESRSLPTHQRECPVS